MQWRGFGISVDGQVAMTKIDLKNRDILRVRDILSLHRCVTVRFFSLYNYSDTERNRLQFVQLPVNWAKSRVIQSNKQ